MLRTTSHAKGISVIEVLIALSMAAIIFVSIGTVLASVHKITSASALREQAQNLAKEQIEIITGIQHDVFGCLCPNESNGSPDDCATTPGWCVQASDFQQCKLSSGYTSCWTPFPEGFENMNLLDIEKNGTSWSLVDDDDQFIDDTTFKRNIALENIDGDSNRKKVTSTVTWNTNNKDYNVTYSTILTAWQNQ